MSSSSKASLYVTIAACSFGLLAPLSALSENFLLDTKLIALLGFLLSTLFFGIMSKVSGFSLISSFQLCFKHKNIRKLLLLRILAGTNLFILFWAFSKISNKLYGIIISESYPLLAVILASFMLKKENISLMKWFLIFIALVGLTLIPINEMQNSYYSASSASFSLFSHETKFLVLILVGTALSAISAVTEPEITSLITDVEDVDAKEAAFVSKYVTNMATSVFVVILYFLTTSPTEYSFPTLSFSSAIFALSVFAFALFVDVIPGYFSRIAGPLITDNTIYTLWMLSPIIGAGALVVIEGTDLNTLLVLSGFLIIGGNALIETYQKIPPFLYSCLLFVLLITPIISLIEPINYEQYFDVISLMTVFVALLTGFTLVRLFELDRDLISFAARNDKDIFMPMYKARERYLGELIVGTFISFWLILAIIVLGANEFWMNIFKLIMTIGVFSSSVIGWLNYTEGKKSIDQLYNAPDVGELLREDGSSAFNLYTTNYLFSSVFLLPIFIGFAIFALYI